jgi:Mrp family chromosome partitioning ATPase
VEVVERASVPTTPSSPKTTRNTLIGVAAGLLLGILAALLRAGFDRRLRGARDIEEETRLPMLAAVRKSALGKVNFGDPQSGSGEAEVDLEAFRILHTNVEYMNPEKPPRRVLVTSPGPGEGKSTVAASLAVVAGLAGRRVLLVEADMRRPVLAEWLGLPQGPGLAEYLVGRAEPREIVRAVALAPAVGANGAEEDPAAGDAGTGTSDLIGAITAGHSPPRPAELLRSKHFADFIATASQAYDLVVFDSPPLLPVTDALDLVEHTDAVVLCVRSGETTRDEVRAAVEALRRLPSRPTGFVITGVTSGTEGDYGYYGYTHGATAAR